MVNGRCRASLARIGWCTAGDDHGSVKMCVFLFFLWLSPFPHHTSVFFSSLEFFFPCQIVFFRSLLLTMHEGYYIGSVVLYGLWVTPLIILWAMSLCLARGKGDPARTGFAWMKALFPIYIVSLIFLTVGQIIIVYLIYGDSSIGSTLFRDLDNAGNHLQSVGSFLLSVADILLLVTFAELASGFLLCVKGKPLAKPARISILASAGLLFILSIVMVGLSSKAITASYDYLKTSSRNRTSAMRAARDQDILNANRMIGAFAVLLWIASLPILGLISWVVHEVRNARHLRNVRPHFPPFDTNTLFTLFALF